MLGSHSFFNGARCSSLAVPPVQVSPAAAAAACQAHRSHRTTTIVVYSSAAETDQQLDEVVAEAAARVGWDPHGLLPTVDGPVDHFARRARQKQQPTEQQQQQQQQHEDDDLAAVDARSSASAAVSHGAYTTAVQQQQQQQQLEQLQQQQQQSGQLEMQQHQQQQPQVQQQQQQQQLQQQQQQPAAAEGDDGGAKSPAAEGDDGGAKSPVRVSSPATAAFAPSDPVQRIPALWLKQGGIPASDAAAYDRQGFVEKLATKFIPINLDYPGLRIINYDPAVFTVEGFMTPAECLQWQQAADESGCLQQSKIGGGNASAAAGDGSVNVYGARRTSSSLLLDAATQARAPALASLMALMQGRASKLLAHLDGGRSWGAPGKMPAGGQYCYENPQVARYTTGQHFLAHEDGFPPLLATANGFQRHATLLLYLNDVQQGGATHFDHLGVSVQPRQGMALLFFPAYANGSPDARSLHTAQDAADTKWVMQQWIARGYPTPKAVLKAVQVAAKAGPEVDVAAAGAAGGAAAAGGTQPLEREVFKVVASSSSTSGDGYGSQPGKGKAKRANKKGSGGSKKGFSRR